MARSYALAALLLIVSSAVNAQVGRYQIVIPQGQVGQEQFLLDTQTGMSWFLIRSPCEGENKKIPGCAINTWTAIPFHAKTQDGYAGTALLPPPPGSALTAPIGK